MNKPILYVSFSGGETSAYMSYILKNKYSKKYDLRFLFANTGEENEETLIFIEKCDKAFGLNVTWVEAVTHPEHGKGQTFKVVDFETASRNGEPYEGFIAKEGIPSMSYPLCTERLKTRPMNKYKKSLGHLNTLTAIGIRTDEKNRRSGYGEQKYNLVYPMLDWFPSDKQDVNTFWENQLFRLELKPHQGNCKTCWKKTDKKLWLIAKENPSAFDFNKRMEEKYSLVKRNHAKKDLFGDYEIPRRFFRGHKTAARIIEEAKNMDIKDLNRMVSKIDDRSSGCGESCEPYQIDLINGVRHERNNKTRPNHKIHPFKTNTRRPKHSYEKKDGSTTGD